MTQDRVNCLSSSVSGHQRKRIFKELSNRRPSIKSMSKKVLTPVPKNKPSQNQWDNSSLDFLGYDWISGVLDNHSRKLSPQKPGCPSHSSKPGNHKWLEQSELFDDIQKFRRTNYESCVSQLSYWANSLSKPEPYKTRSDISAGRTISRRLKPPSSLVYGLGSHMGPSQLKCQSPPVYSCSLNPRLFPIPCNTLGNQIPTVPYILRVTVPLRYFHHPPELLSQVSILKDRERNEEAFQGSYQKPGKAGDQDLKCCTERMLGTISLIGHCLTGLDGERLPLSRGTITVQPSSGGKIVNLPQWLRKQPSTEDEMNACLSGKLVGR